MNALAGCSARRSEGSVAGHTTEEQRRNAPVGTFRNGILAVSASLRYTPDLTAAHAPAGNCGFHPLPRGHTQSILATLCVGRFAVVRWMRRHSWCNRLSVRLGSCGSALACWYRTRYGCRLLARCGAYYRVLQIWCTLRHRVRYPPNTRPCRYAGILFYADYYGHTLHKFDGTTNVSSNIAGVVNTLGNRVNGSSAAAATL